jgi:hypothetical protein
MISSQPSVVGGQLSVVRQLCTIPNCGRRRRFIVVSQQIVMFESSSRSEIAPTPGFCAKQLSGASVQSRLTECEIGVGDASHSRRNRCRRRLPHSVFCAAR